MPRRFAPGGAATGLLENIANEQSMARIGLCTLCTSILCTLCTVWLLYAQIAPKT